MFCGSCDGCVAQTRLVKVMLANSVVIKEESDWIEYYYRCGLRYGFPLLLLENAVDD
jgi:hypothetical protein